MFKSSQLILLFFILAILPEKCEAVSCGCEYQYAKRCSGGQTQGAKNLAAYFKRKFGATHAEIYNCRTIAGSNSYSLHAEGRAVDVFLSDGKGREAFDHAVEIACDSGIQEAIFNRRIWTKGLGERAYNGANPHIDHVHIGLNKCGAKNFNL